MEKLPLKIAAVGRVNGRYGIGVAARKHTELLAEIAEQVTIHDGWAKGAADIVYHHGAPMAAPPPWYAGRHVIAYWVVESSVAAAEFRAAADACAQIWTCSEASANAIRSLGSATPVFVIPHPVAVPEQRPDRRGRDTITTLFAFAPGWERKNPEAVIRAWKRAFPRSKKARLVIKCRNMGEAAAALLKHLTADDDRIECLFGDVTETAMAALYERADIFLSLHRAGAFELHVAEAAAHGLPIICTKVGGVTSYLNDKAAIFIGGRQVASRMDDAFNRAGEWMEPNEDEAVAALVKLAGSASLRRKMGVEGRWCVKVGLDGESIRLLMKSALKEAMKLPAPNKNVVAAPNVVMRREPPIPMTPALRPVRSGLEFMGEGGGRIPPVGTPVVVSHRRSGTHLFGEFIARHWDCAWMKTHHFPEALPGLQYPRLYVLRNPIDTLHSAWRWWRGSAGNADIKAALTGMDFADWLAGKAGHIIGYRSLNYAPVDNCEVTRGMMYDPLRYWFDHWKAAAEAGMRVVLYEDMLRRPAAVAVEIKKALHREPTRRIEKLEEPVGFAPSGNHQIGKGWNEWPEWAENVLHKLLTPQLLGSIGVESLEDWAS